MYRLVETELFSAWLAGLRDRRARTRIQMRLDRLALGNPGDVKAVGSGLSELRIDYGPGYRVYFFRRDREIIILVAGGDMRTQRRDIQTATELMEEIRSAL
jgi:putative addiction module killer protein